MKESMSLVELATELERQREAKVDYLVPQDRIHFATPVGARSEIDLLAPQGSFAPNVADGLVLNDVAHGQFADRLTIPKRYYDRLRGEVPDLLDHTVNRLLRVPPRPTNGRQRDPGKWMIRTLDGTARAALSDQYRRIDNQDIAEAILPVLYDIPDVQIRSAHISEKFMFIKATTPRVTGQVKVGEAVCAGVYVQNSEVGWGKFVVAPFIETLSCTNGMTVMRRGSGMMEQIHLGSRVEGDALGRILSHETRVVQDRAFMMTVRDVVRAAVDEARFAELVEAMSRAAEDEPVRDVAAAVEVLSQREGLTEHEGRGILTYLARGGDLSRWGMLSAVTRMAEDVDSYDRATELEMLGGKILDYRPRQWTELVAATPEIAERRRRRSRQAEPDSAMLPTATALTS